MKKLGLIYNPVSGHALFKGKLDSLIDMFQRHGILLCPYRTRGGGRTTLDTSSVNCVRTAYSPQEAMVQYTPL